MENFNYTKKDNYTQQDLDIYLEQHRNFVYKETKKEYEPKIKEYETKVNQYEEKELFNGFNDKQIKIAKSLINTEYKDLGKSDALEKMKTEYVEIFGTSNNSNEEVNSKPDNKELLPFNMADLLKLDTVNKTKSETSLNKKAKTIGITDRKELQEFAQNLFSTVK